METTEEILALVMAIPSTPPVQLEVPFQKYLPNPPMDPMVHGLAEILTLPAMRLTWNQMLPTNNVGDGCWRRILDMAKHRKWI